MHKVYKEDQPITSIYPKSLTIKSSNDKPVYAGCDGEYKYINCYTSHPCYEKVIYRKRKLFGISWNTRERRYIWFNLLTKRFTIGGTKGHKSHSRSGGFYTSRKETLNWKREGLTIFKTF